MLRKLGSFRPLSAKSLAKVPVQALKSNSSFPGLSVLILLVRKQDRTPEPQRLSSGLYQKEFCADRQWSLDQVSDLISPDRN